MDIEKFNVLTALVKEARELDKAAFDEMEASKLRWKSVNETLTERQKVLDGFIAQSVSEATGRK